MPSVRLAWLPLVIGLAACSASQDGALSGMASPSGPQAEGSGATQSEPALTGSWMLLRLQKAGAPAVSIPEPERFVAEFAANGRVHLKADCNVCNTSYSAGESSLSVGLMPCTLAYCQSAPLDTTYVGLVSSATSWSVEADRLTLSSPAGTLLFRR